MHRLANLHLVIAIGPMRFGVPAKVVGEVVLRPRLQRLPAGPAVVEGVMNLRGALVAVVNLPRLLGIAPAAPCGYAAVVVLRILGLTWGIGVDRAVDVVAFAPGRAVPPPPDSSFNDCVEAVVAEPGCSIHLLKPERLLTQRERLVLEELGRLAEARRQDWSC